MVLGIEKNTKNINKKIKKLLPILLLIIVVLGVTTFYFYRKSKLAAQAPSSLYNQNEVKALTLKVGNLVVLPTDETPTVATVSDLEALKDQSFFVDAKVGYKVLIYANAKKAILYDPNLNKVVNIAPLNIGDQKAKASASAPTYASSTTIPAEKQKGQ